MGKKMEMAEGEDKLLGDMLEVIRFTEGVSAKLHRVLDEAKIYQVVKEEFAKSDRYIAGILLLDGDGASLKLAEISIVPSKLKVLERASGLRTEEYLIKLSKSSICRQVVREDKTVHANIGDIIREFLPRPLAYLISKTMGYDKQSSILTPLHRRGKVIGVLGVSCTDLCEYLLHSVENLALHISTALELADEHAQRKRAVQALKRYHDHLGELVEERTGELKAVNEKLREEIGERKEAGEALRKIEQEKLAILNSTSELTVYQDTEHRILWTNKAAAESVALSIEQLAGRHCYEIWPQSNKPCVGCPVAKARETGKPQEAEMTTPDGRVWFVRGYPVRDANENLVGVVEVALDITERKRAEEALRESQEKFQKMFESVTDGISVIDLNGAIIEVNQRTVEMHGFASKDELLGRNALELVVPRDRERIAKSMRKAIKEGTIRGVEYSLLKADGTEFAGELSTSVIRDASGKAVAHITIARDITRRKRAEEALRESEERFRSIVENSQAGIMILDDAYRFTYVNDKLCQISGYSPKEVIGQDFRKFLDEESQQLVAERYIRRQRGKEVPPRYEFNIIHKDGQKRRVEISSAVIKDSAGEVKTVAQILDITERKQAEEALQAEKNKLQSLVDAMEYGLTIQDGDYNIIYEGTLQRTIFGDHLGEKCYRVYEGNEKICDGCPVEKAFKDGKSHTVERRTVTPSGEVIFWENTASPIRDAKGRVVSCLELTRNITERKQAEEKLRLLSSVTQQISDATLVTDTDFNITYVNKAAQDLFSCSTEEMLGKHMDNFNAKPPPESFGQEIKRTVSSGKPWVGTILKKRKDGSTFLCECHISPLYDNQGQISSYIDVLRDITERKQAEEALRESQKFSSSLLASSPNPILVINPDTSIRYVNPAFEKLTGFTLAELEGKKAPHPWWPEEQMEEISAAFKDHMARGGRRTERNFQKKSGERFWVALNSAQVMQDGKPIYLIMNWLDITERKQAEEALNLQRAYFQQLFDNSPDAIALLAKTGRVVQANKGFETLFGYRAEEVEGQRIVGFLVPEDRVDESAALTEIVHSGKVVRKETVRRRKDGSLVDVSLLRYPIRLDSETIGTYAIYSDITERKQAEEALKESQQFSSSLLEGSPNPISVVDLDTSIRYVNPAFEKLTGFTLAEITGREAPYPWWPEGKRARILAAFKDSIKHGGRRTERNFQKKSGERFWVALNSAPVMQDGKAIYLIISWLDITERKQAEEKEKELQQELYLARRLASVGELAAGVAHEINNPLTGVLGFSQRLMRKSTDEGVRRDLEIIHSEARRAADVVQSLLTFARRRQPKKEYANINDIVQKTLELRVYALQTGNIEVVTTLAPRLPRIMVDFPQMQEVFLNIILNAEQAMSEAHGRGKLIIKTRRLKKYVKISFADDGPGISTENLDKVFDPFFTTREGKGGTGLGLSACHGIVTEHGGRIYARSKPGKGATFFVELPLSPDEAAVVH